MNSSRLFRLAFQQSLAAFKQRQWQTLIVALIIAIAVSTLMAVTGERIERSLTARTSELMGADLILRDSVALNERHAEYAQSIGLSTASSVQFPSVINQGDNVLLVTVNAVSDNYPLRGQFLFDESNPNRATTSAPTSGEIWAEPSVYSRLNSTLNSQVQLGYNTPTLSQTMLQGPAQGGGFTRFNPQVLMALEDLPSSKLIAPGSRAQYRLFVAGDIELINQYEQYLQPLLTPGQRIHKSTQAEGVQGGALSNTGKYLRLGAVLTLIISALTILLSLQRYADTLRPRAALMMSFGLRPNQFISLIAVQLAIGGLFSSVVGIIAARFLEELLLASLASVLPPVLPSISFSLYLSGSVIGLAMLFCFGLAPLAALGQVSVSHLFSQMNLPTNKMVRGLQLLAVPLFIGLMWLYLQDIVLALALCLGLPIAATLLGLIGTRAIRVASLLFSKLPLSRLLNIRLKQQARWHRMQVPVISLLLAMMAVSLWARHDLVNQWQTQLPEGTPNHFMINVQPYQNEEIDQILAQSNVTANLLPMVRGRLTELNGQIINSQDPEQRRRHDAFRRALNLTWSSELPQDNEIIAGTWHGDQVTTEGNHLVSIEAETAESLGLNVGDTVGLNIAGSELKATISSIRTVVWESFQPNFYLIFSEGALDNLPATYITSFYLEPEQKGLINTLLKAHPTLTVVDIDILLEQAKVLIDNLSQASELIMGLGLLAGLVLVFVTLNQELEKRQYENALLQTFGATARTCLQLDLAEMALLGIVCGLFGAALTEVTLWLIYTQQLQIAFSLHWQNWVLLPLTALILFVVLGSLARKRQSVRNSYQILRRFSTK